MTAAALRPDLTISIVNTDNRRLLKDCLSSIPTGSEGLETEVFVVDNASTDGSGDMVAREFPGVHLLGNRERHGFAANHNQVLRQARGRHTLILNEDTVVRPGALLAMVGYMDHHPEVGMLGCQLLNPDGTPQTSCYCAFPSLLFSFLESSLLYAVLDRFFPNTRYPGRMTQPLDRCRETHEVAHLLGAAILIRRAALEEVGLLDEGFYIYREETDLCLRFRRRGHKIVYFPEAHIVHLGGESMGREPERATRIRLQSNLRYYRKHRGLLVAGLWWATSLAGCLLAIAWTTLAARLRPRGRQFYRALTARSLTALRLHFRLGVEGPAAVRKGCE
ncbi:MAG: glycosyltransferase family 2 protein [Chloroflexi bacterium]|nr:glycosyltransferase family 2 protein [Chloroflexota bacterium]